MTQDKTIKHDGYRKTIKHEKNKEIKYKRRMIKQ